MDVKTFVSQSLSQIVDGIKEAQALDQSGSIAPRVGQFDQKSVRNIFQVAGGYCTAVEFDVSVFGGESDGGSTLKVSSMEMTEGVTKTNHNTSRICFSVHLRLPSPQSKA